MTELTPPPLTLEVEVNGKLRTIKMVYGLELDIRRMMPEPNDAMRTAMLDPFTQDYIVRRCLTEKKGMITDPDELIDPEEFEIDSDTSSAIMLWCVEHILYFFATRVEGLKNLTAQYGMQPPTTPDALSNSGTEPSPSPTPSAGDSE